MGWNQGCIPEIVSSPLPVVEGFFDSQKMKRVVWFFIGSQVSATTAALVSAAMINYLNKVCDS